jgi:hypothetical protein
MALYMLSDGLSVGSVARVMGLRVSDVEALRVRAMRARFDLNEARKNERARRARRARGQPVRWPERGAA